MTVAPSRHPRRQPPPPSAAKLKGVDLQAGTATSPLIEIRRIAARESLTGIFERSAEIATVLHRTCFDTSTYAALAHALDEPIRPEPGWQRLLVALRAGMLHLQETAPQSFLVLRRLALALALDARRAGYDDPLPWPMAGRTQTLALFCRGTEQADIERDIERDLAMLAYAMYLPPPTDFATLVEARGTTLPEASRLIAETVGRQMDMQRTSSHIDSLGPISDGMSQRVRDHHESHPFPIWRDRDSGAAGEMPPAEMFRGRVSASLFRQHIRILVPGCGTGKHAISLARSDPSAQIVAFDLSTPSLAYAACKARELGVRNITFASGDVFTLPGSLGQFAQIEAMGMVHHTADPQKAVKILASHLLPGGVIKLGVYSARVRAPLRAVRTALNELPPTVLYTRGALLGAVMDAPYHSVFAPLKRNRDFYAVPSRRDLLFHPCEASFTPADTAELGRRAGLNLLGFGFWSAEHKRAFHQRFPNDPLALDPDNIGRFENQHPGVFARMIVAYFTKEA